MNIPSIHNPFIVTSPEYRFSDGQQTSKVRNRTHLEISNEYFFDTSLVKNIDAVLICLFEDRVQGIRGFDLFPK